jgi:hypothetical protein
MINDREAEIKEKAIEKILSNQLNLLRMALHHWRNTTNSLAISDALTGEKKRFLINSMMMFLKGSNNSLLRTVLRKFADEAAIKKKIRVINLRLLNTVAGGLFDSFNKWKTIPSEREDMTKASIFGEAL